MSQQPLDPECPHCGSDMFWQKCEDCDENGFTHHDCGEDTCCCLNPLPNVKCDMCDGEGGWWRCLSECKTEEEKR